MFFGFFFCLKSDVLYNMSLFFFLYKSHGWEILYYSSWMDSAEECDKKTNVA